MITCELNGKKYSVDYVSGRALREIGPAADMYSKLVKMTNAAMKGEDVDIGDLTLADALDVMVKWFCVLFGNQFTPDEFYDYYPADRTVADLSLAILVVQSSATNVLNEFPTKPAAEKTTTMRATRTKTNR